MKHMKDIGAQSESTVSDVSSSGSEDILTAEDHEHHAYNEGW